MGAPEQTTNYDFGVLFRGCKWSAGLAQLMRSMQYEIWDAKGAQMSQKVTNKKALNNL